MAKSLQDFREWAMKKGTVSNPTLLISARYPGQCVSLVQQYLEQVFGIPYAPRGNGVDFTPPTFRKLPKNTIPKPGDIIRYGHPHGIINGRVYGHVGIIDDRGHFLDQNGVKKLAVGSRKTPLPKIESVWRPTKKFAVKNPKKKSNAAIAEEVLAGKWGNGNDRLNALTKAGYNYAQVQAEVNKLVANKKKPAPAPTKKYHTVKRGDTMSRIAQKHKTTVANLSRMNPQIKNINLIFPGQKVRIK